jgi:hypothetical protein
MSVHQRHPSQPGPVPPAEPGPSLLGFPAEYDDEGYDESGRPPGAPQGVRLVVVRRGDPVAAAALVIAGVAAVMSLWVPWRRGDPALGAELVRRGLEEARSGMAGFVSGPLWPTVAVVVGGGILLLLGVLLIRPARTHRLVGVLELLVAAVVAAGVLVVLAAQGWSAARFGIGAWCAVAVAAFGIVGALKAVLTTPRVVAERTGSTVPGGSRDDHPADR